MRSASPFQNDDSLGDFATRSVLQVFEEEKSCRQGRRPKYGSNTTSDCRDRRKSHHSCPFQSNGCETRNSGYTWLRRPTFKWQMRSRGVSGPTRSIWDICRWWNHHSELTTYGWKEISQACLDWHQLSCRAWPDVAPVFRSSQRRNYQTFLYSTA